MHILNPLSPHGTRKVHGARMELKTFSPTSGVLDRPLKKRAKGERGFVVLAVSGWKL
jgi:hypothetical protein